MSEMGRGKKAGEEAKPIWDPNVVRQGILKRWKVRVVFDCLEVCVLLVTRSLQFKSLTCGTWDFRLVC